MNHPVFSKNSQKFIGKLPSKQLVQIFTALTNLIQNPHPNTSRHLKGHPNYKRVPSGEFRIIYSFENKILNIAEIGKRNDDEVYKNFSR